MSKLIDLTGKKFGRLTVLSFHHNKTYKNGQIKKYWLCKCECGNFKIIAGAELRNGNIRSCGCLHKEMISNLNKKHNKAGTRLYSIWQGMKTRCLNKKVNSYKNYGDRNITICNEWFDFENFYNWAMNNGYKDNLTLDRIDNNNGYNPKNCKWRTYKQQANNTRKNKIITYNGKNHTLSEWAEIYNFKYMFLYDRLRLGWSFEQAINTPKRKNQYL